MLVALSWLLAGPSRGEAEALEDLRSLQDRSREALAELRYEEAAKFAQGALELAGQHFHGGSSEYIPFLLDYARPLIAWGYVDEAMLRLEEAQRLANRSTTEGQGEIAEIHAIRSKTLSRQGLWVKALAELDRAGEIWRRLLPAEDLAIGAYALERGTILMRLGRAAEAEVAANDALAIYQKIIPPDHRSDEAAPRYLSVHKKYKNIYGYAYSVALKIESMSAQGQIAHANNNFGGKLSAVESNDFENYFPDKVLFMKRYAEILKLLNDEYLSKEYYSNAFEYWDDHGLLGHHEAIDLTINYGLLLISMSRLNEAERLLKEALVRAELARPQDPLQIAALLSALAEATANQPGTSAQFRQRAQAFGPPQGAGAGLAEVMTMIEAGDRLSARSAYPAAEREYRAALAATEATGALAPAEHAVLVMKLAQTLLAQRKAAAFEEAVLQAEQIYETGNISDADVYLKLRVAKARVLLAKRDFAGAETILGVALTHPDVFGQGDSPGPNFLAIFEALADVQFQQGRTVEAAGTVSTVLGMRTLPQNAATILSSGPFFRQAQYRYLLANQEMNGGSDSGEFFLSAFRSLQWAQAGVLGQAIEAGAQRLAVGPSVASLQRELEDIEREVAEINRSIDQIMALQSRPNRQTLTEVEELRRRRADLVEGIPGLRSRIEAFSPEYQPAEAFEPTSYADIKSLLAPDEALLTITLYRDLEEGKERVLVIAVQGGANGRGRHATTTIELGSDDDFSRVRALAQRLRCSAALADPDCVPVTGCIPAARAAEATDLCGDWESAARPTFDFATAAELYDLLIPAALRNHIAGRKLLIAPDADLLGLPFHLLLTAPLPEGLGGMEANQKASWLFQSYPSVAILPAVSNLSDLRQAMRRPPAPHALIGFGDPVVGTWDAADCTSAFSQIRPRGFDVVASGLIGDDAATATSLADVEAIRSLASLPETRCELSAIAGLFPAESDAALFLGADATERTVKALNEAGALSRYRVLHFATHAVVAGDLGSSNTEAGLVLTPPAAASTSDDGLLTTREIANFRLNADMVVLSACNTAAGNRRGVRALGGLAGAFFAAGARSLLVSHWPIASPAAVDLTTRSFAAQAANPALDRGEALVLAMRGALQAARTEAEAHPSWWGPFALVGNALR